MLRFRLVFSRRTSCVLDIAHIGKYTNLRLLCHAPLLTSQECAYTLRYAEYTNRDGKLPWSLRQMTTYHRYKKDDTAPYSTWILVGASARAEFLLDLYCRNINKPMTDMNPFEIHVMFLDIAVASWRPYLVDIGNEITTQVGWHQRIFACI